jgi:hypothetical protein
MPASTVASAILALGISLHGAARAEWQTQRGALPPVHHPQPYVAPPLHPPQFAPAPQPWTPPPVVIVPVPVKPPSAVPEWLLPPEVLNSPWRTCCF